MKYTIHLISSLLLSIVPLTFAHAERCGPGNIFEGSDYCVACGQLGTKVSNCPGGEVGRVAVGLTHPGCSVSYYYNGCENGIAALNVNDDHNNVRPDHPSLNKEGDEVIIRMKEKDFDKLMKRK